jgi:3-methyladenine DNA glycosylase Mpg
LVVGITAGAIVDVKAYIGASDAVCYAASVFIGLNARLHGSPWLVYVYLNYGIPDLVNAVTEFEGFWWSCCCEPSSLSISSVD